MQVSFTERKLILIIKGKSDFLSLTIYFTLHFQRKFIPKIIWKLDMLNTIKSINISLSFLYVNSLISTKSLTIQTLFNSFIHNFWAIMTHFKFNLSIMSLINKWEIKFFRTWKGYICHFIDHWMGNNDQPLRIS